MIQKNQEKSYVGDLMDGGIVHLGNHKLREALDGFNQALSHSINPLERSRALLFQGHAYHDLGEENMAIDHYRKAYLQDRQNIDARFFLGYELASVGERKLRNGDQRAQILKTEGMQHLTEVIGRNPIYRETLAALLKEDTIH